MQEMDPKIKRRITAFYIGGIINAVLGFYVLINGFNFLAADTARSLAMVFLLFAAVDFYFPYAIKKKWLAEQDRKRRGGAAAPLK